MSPQPCQVGSTDSILQMHPCSLTIHWTPILEDAVSTSQSAARASHSSERRQAIKRSTFVVSQTVLSATKTRRGSVGRREVLLARGSEKARK